MSGYLQDRIKNEASIDYSGRIVLGEAKAGFRTGNLELTGDQQYLLEDGLGHWEIGFTSRDYLGAEYTSGSGATLLCRKPLMGDTGGDTQFAHGTTGLTYSQIALARNMWNVAEIEGINGGIASAWGGGGDVHVRVQGGLAVGANAVVQSDSDFAIAIGPGTSVGSRRAVLIGSELYADGLPGSVHMGAYYMPHCISVPFRGAATNGGGATASTAFSSTESPTTNYTELEASNIYSWMPGMSRVRGSMYITTAADAGDHAYLKAVTFDYVVFCNDSSVFSVLGTPTITAVATGGSHPASAITIDATRCVPAVAASGGANLVWRGVMTVDLCRANVW